MGTHIYLIECNIYQYIYYSFKQANTMTFKVEGCKIESWVLTL